MTCTICNRPSETDVCLDCQARIDAYRERRESRIDRLEDRARRVRIKAQNLTNNAHRMAEGIPFGQPILIGHHSEGRDRRYRERIRNQFRKGFELHGAASDIERRAEAARANRAISSDDPEAVLKLRAKIEKAEGWQKFMKDVNRRVRQLLKRAELDDTARGELLLKGFPDFKTVERAVEFMQPDYLGRIGFPDYSLKNNNANIRRMKQRLKGLEKKVQALAKADEPVQREQRGDIVIERDMEENRLRLIFPGKPEQWQRDILKRRGFVWSKSNGAWQRQLNNGAEWAADEVIGLFSQNPNRKVGDLVAVRPGQLAIKPGTILTIARIKQWKGTILYTFKETPIVLADYEVTDASVEQLTAEPRFGDWIIFECVEEDCPRSGHIVRVRDGVLFGEKVITVLLGERDKPGTERAVLFRNEIRELWRDGQRLI